MKGSTNPGQHSETLEKRLAEIELALVRLNHDVTWIKRLLVIVLGALVAIWLK